MHLLFVLQLKTELSRSSKQNKIAIEVLHLIVKSERPEVIIEQCLIEPVFNFVFNCVEHCSCRFRNGLSVLIDFNAPTRYII